MIDNVFNIKYLINNKMGSKPIHLIHYFKRKDKVLICTGEDLIKICNITSKGTIQDIREMKMVADKVSTAVIFNE